jgi:hypothetical protein
MKKNIAVNIVVYLEVIIIVETARKNNKKGKI